MVFFVYVWVVWAAKALAARRYRPFEGTPGPLTATVLVPVFREPEAVFRRALASVCAERPHELIAIVDGGDAAVAAVAIDYCDRVLRVPKAGKRAAIAAGLAAADPSTDVVVVLDSDTVWAPGALGEMLRPFADPRVGGVTPRQAIFDVGDDPGPPARRLDRGPALPADGAGAVRVRPGRLPRGAHDRLPAHGVRAGRRRARPPDGLRPAPARRRRPRADQRAAARRLADRLPVDRAGVDGRAAGLAHVLAPAAALGPLEPARDAAAACAGCGGGRSRSRRSRPTS